MMRHAKRMIAMLLAVIMLMQISPITQMKVFAADESMGEAVEAEQLAEILYEDVTQREENSKRYRLADGKWIAAVYEDSVHYEVDGQWEDIDNTLKSSTESYRIPVEQGKVIGEYTVNGFVEIGDTEVMLETTEIPEEVTEPEVTETPEEVAEPEVTDIPEEIIEGEMTDIPEEAAELEVAEIPEAVTEPEAAETPEETIEPEASGNSETEIGEVESDPTTIGESAAVEIEPITPPVVTLEPITPTPGFKDVSEQVWVNTANDIGISLPATLTGDSRVRVSSKGYALYFAPVLENGKSDGNVSLMALREQGIAAQQIAIDNGSDDVRLKGIENKARSGLTYAEVLPGVNMEYHLQSRTLKETIVVDRAENMPATIGYTISAAGLTPVVNEDSSIHFVADGEVIFYLPAPYMFDSENAYSFEIAVSLQALDNGEYLLTYTPDAEWINAEERVWPVCIDPVVGISPSTSTVEDTFVCGGKGTTNYEGLNYLYVGKLDADGAARAYVKFKSLPSLTSSDVVINAYMYMQGIEMSGSQMTVSAYKVLSSWNKSTLTWNTKPGSDATALDYQIVAYANRSKQFCWDITQAAKSWYSKGDNHGIELRSDAESNSTGVVIKFGSAEREAGLRPNLMIYYTSNTGLESFWDYTSQDVGRAGTAHVNNFTGNLVVSRTDMSYGGNKMPAAIIFNYNYTDRNTELGYGYGWRMNYNHKVTIESGTTGTSSYTYYRWVDGDGTRRNFNFASSHWYDETGQGYILTENTGSTTARFVITDKSGSRLEFDGYGRLKKVVDPNVSSNCVTIDYAAASSSNLRIKKITDGAGRVYNFTYGATTVDRLSQITYVGTGTSAVNTVKYSYYDSGALKNVTFNDGKTATYTYNSTSLTNMKNDVNGESVTPTYTGGQVTKLSYADGSEVSSATFDYEGNSTKVTDKQGCWVTYQFNDYGNTTGVFNDCGQAVFGSYAQDKNSSNRANQLVDSSRLQDTVVNLIQNPSFELSGYWDNKNVDFDAAAKQTGAVGVKMNNGGEYVAYPYTFKANQTYSVSAAVKSDGTAKARVALYATPGNGTPVASSETTTNTAWTRIDLTYTPASDKFLYVIIEQIGSGVIYLDDAQLEVADASSRYNLLINGDLNGGTGWSYKNTSGTDGTTTNTETRADSLDNNVLLLNKSYLVEKSASQTVSISNGVAGDKYTFGVWVKSPSVPLDNSRAPGDTAKRQCGIKVQAMDGSTEVESATVLINDSCGDWQYLCGNLTVDGDYTSVVVSLLFDYCQNTAMFDGAQLFRESYGYHYEYDDDGNVTSVTDLSGNKTTYTYGNGNSDVTKITMPNGSTYTYTYNSARQVTQDKNTLNTTNQYTYDSYGNLTKQTTGYSGASASIVSESTYEGNGNMTKSVTTADRQTINYTNDLNKSLVTAVTDPLKRVTSYTYDSMDRPLTVTRGSSTLTYVYSADAVNTISHTGGNPTTYTFNYGVADVLNSVMVGATELVKNVYNNLTWNLLSQTYANGQKWTYEYYTHGDEHQSSELKSKSDGTNKFVYYYSNDGAVARIEYYSGSTLKQVEKYYYDTSDRLCRVVGLNGSTTEPSILYEYSWTYDNNNNVTNLVETIGGVKTTYNYGYNTEQQASSAAYGKTNKTFAYDSYGRFNYSIVNYNGAERVKEYVEYKIATDGNATNQVSRFISKWSKSSTSYSSEIYQYTYDANGNITAIKDGNANNLVTYQYDSNDQLQWERNYQAGKAWKYTYDTGGNIKSKTTYSSADATSGGTAVSYTYDTTWGDKLTKVGSNTVTSDASGNITAYNGWTYTYKGGRQLASAKNGSTTLNFTYNDADLRTSKTGHTYTYNGSLLASDVTSSYALYFRYDQNGAPIGFAYKTGSTSTEYYYLKNLQGDITGIVDTSGNRVATYVYDAWGNHLSAPTSGVGYYNPLRYRGYVYDTESSLYYLQSRYYSPVIGRFISADSYAMTHSSSIGANMFVYCMNNPIACCDGDGEVAETIFDVVSLGISITEVAVNPADPWAWLGLAGDVLDLLPVVTGIGETARVIEVSVKATALSDDVITTARYLNKSDVAEKFCKKVGSYEISYSDGTKYVGKGSFYRATVSAKEHLTDSNTVKSISWRSSSNSAMAFLDEYARQLKNNFKNNEDLLNVIWSPGRRIASDLKRAQK